MKIASLVLVLISINFIQINAAQDWWIWKCDSVEYACRRFPKKSNNAEAIDETEYPTVELCRLMCGNSGRSLWPKPRISTVIGTNLVKFSSKQISVTISAQGEALAYLQESEKYLMRLLTTENTDNCQISQNSVQIQLVVSSPSVKLDWSTDESYTLEIASRNNIVNVKIQSSTFFGSRHGVETLSQLIECYPDEGDKTCLAIVNEARIADRPAYPHRGLLVDTARNYQSISTIKKHLDAMAASKLNVFHWHISDTQSIPLQLPSLPEVSRLAAYSSSKVYTAKDVSDLAFYAKTRGIRILLEFDAPSHAGNGWQWTVAAGYGNVAVCINREPWRSYCIQPPCGQLNPINSNVYKILEKLYSDMNSMVPDSGFFHMGGDEVYLPCWNDTAEIISHLKGNRSTEAFLNLWSQFQEKASLAYAKTGGSDTPLIVWTSHLTQSDVIEKYLPKQKYVIQTWVPQTDPLPMNLINLGYRIIVSTKDAWYLDHGVWGNTVYHNWRVAYNNRIPEGPATLGGEACMWGEYVDDSSVLSRAWPRAAAVGERLWSNPNLDSLEVEKRFFRHRERLVSRGINSEALAPRWCYQNEGGCP